MSGSALSAVGISILQVAAAYTSTSITLPGLDSASWNATICFSISALVLVLTLVLYSALRSDDHTVLDQKKNFKDFDVEELPSEQPRSMYGCNFSVFYTAVVTLCLFPAITASIESTNKKIDPLVFNALHFLVFNIADLVGRFFSSIPFISPTNDTFLIAYSVLRSLFIPFFVACNFAGSSEPSFITSDAVYMLGLFLFGLTHGHCSTISLVAASKREDDAQNGRGARLAQFWMMVGIVVGGGASFGVHAIL
ncbi:Nucleoside transporter [Ceratobasidium sp. AG-Ba]|nr:Nucleoside transporter [Ceratobasidium sp. AG-Ba]